MTGRESVMSALSQATVNLCRLKADVSVERHIVEQLSQEAHSLRSQAEATTAQNGLFVLSENARALNRRITALLPENDPAVA